MSVRIFIDANILIDLLTDREPFASDAALLFEQIATGKLLACTSANCLANVYYVLSSATKQRNVREKIGELIRLLEVVPTDSEILNKALSSDFRDFEDAIQYYSALECDARYIVTRNPKDFKKSRLRVVDAREMSEIMRSG
jgi:predicted nucleic acid-binding protein